ncbi:protein of unknown function (plasmid) [Pseudorhizobium banfieldiae]|uniref:Uncharacterized protein n=1 Tax=Pseudorhizobium banfieldiae TaxID=1125847 RepID=L0NMF0_9HYPH|nr:protein of unknown function [Pseudorhizobium banfieldiae]
MAAVNVPFLISRRLREHSGAKEVGLSENEKAILAGEEGGGGSMGPGSHDLNRTDIRGERSNRHEPSAHRGWPGE